MALKRLPFLAFYRSLVTGFSAHSKLENLSLLEAMTAVRVGYRPVSFVTASALVRGLLQAAYRENLAERILLPESAIVAALLRLSFRSRALAPIPAAEFIPVLLTYMAEPKRLVLAGSNRQRLSAARDFIRAHVPWHQVYAAHLQLGAEPGAGGRLMAEIAAVKPHLVLVDSSTIKQELLLERELSLAYDGLALFCPGFFAACPTHHNPPESGSDDLSLTLYSSNKFSLS
ncbi:WecB/TagA/CpsF family glycosyltransferase [Rhizobium helianthi]|uniref:WecB/TagA/CpsF family glycosyltransferase n=1 Tax=Rhizobium helianthi TaxID=1132695 RepID=A0ABW4M457_9HYPH